MKFDHDFIGREALEGLDAETQRKKVTLAWNAEDVAEIFASLLDVEGPGYQVFDLPNANYGSSNFDSVVDAGWQHRRSLDVHRLQRQRAARRCRWRRRPAIPVGTELPWSGASPARPARPTSSRTCRRKCASIVSPVPYAVTARLEYAEGWRTAAK